jgi:DnaJ-class molecular chaperone
MANGVPEDTECPRCHGTGKRAGETCNLCGGSGRVPVTQYPPDTNPYKEKD